MYQLVNMYQPVFRRQAKILSATTLMSIITLVMVLMFAFYLNANASMRGLQRTSEELALNHMQLDAQIGALISNTTLTGDASVSDKIETLQAQIKDRSALLEKIDSLVLESNVDFGEIFETLAQANLPGLWLTGVQLEHDGSIEISGTAINPKLVPRYLQLITRKSQLASLNSGTVNVIREESDLSEINFVLSYNAQGDEQ